MSRSIKKGPFVAPELIKRVEEMNKTKETIFPEVIYFDEKYVDSETFRNALCHRLAHTAVAEFSFCLSLELRLCELDGDDCRKTFSDVLTAQFLASFEDARLGAVIVDYLRQRGFEAVKMRAALFGVDVVCKRQNRVGVQDSALQEDCDPPL